MARGLLEGLEVGGWRAVEPEPLAAFLAPLAEGQLGLAGGAAGGQAPVWLLAAVGRMCAAVAAHETAGEGVGGAEAWVGSSGGPAWARELASRSAEGALLAARVCLDQGHGQAGVEAAAAVAAARHQVCARRGMPMWTRVQAPLTSPKPRTHCFQDHVYGALPRITNSHQLAQPTLVPDRPLLQVPGPLLEQALGAAVEERMWGAGKSMWRVVRGLN